MKPLRILAVSGSLRARSSNAEVLRAATMLAPDEFLVTLYEGVGDLPHFNPDLDRPESVIPPVVADLRARIAAAHAVLISTPEYAHGVPGSLKNALDWLVSGPEIPGKPIAVLMTSRYSVHAPAALSEILRTMSARVVALEPGCVSLDGRRLAATQVLADPDLARVLRAALESLRAAHNDFVDEWPATTIAEARAAASEAPPSA
ncbi:MAG: NADPH-dependent FMN reductase [Gemmatimonadota bacterium]